MQVPTPHPGSIQPGATSIRRQHGSMAIAMMLMLLGLITILGIVEVGYLYWAHRDAQKVADLAALSGAQQLNGPACLPGSPAYVAATSNANDNGGTAANGYSGIDVSCGRQPASGSSILAPASASSVAAIKVVVNRDVNHLFGSGMAWKSTFPIKAEAVAINSQPIAAFSVGSTLLGLSDSSPLNNLLNSTLKTSLGLQVLSNSGIANANISLIGLIHNLKNNNQDIDIGTVSNVLSAPISLGDFLQAYIQALPQGTDTSAITAWINSLNVGADLGDTKIDLGDILNVNANTDDPEAALNTTVSALGILQTAILAANSKNALALPETSIDIPDVAHVGMKVSIVEPPQIGVGGIGATAHTAVVRVQLDVSALDTPLTGQSLLDLPLYIEVARADATIKNIQCNVPSTTTKSGIADNVTIHADAGAANVLLGKVPSDIFTNTSLPWSSITPKPVDLVNVSVDLLGFLGIHLKDLATVSASSKLTLTTTPPGDLDFSIDPTMPVADQDTSQSLSATPPVVLTSILSDLMDPTKASLQASVSVAGGLISLDATPLLANLASALLKTVSGLDSNLLGPLLQLTGISIGTAQVKLLSVNCNSGAQLVY